MVPLPPERSARVSGLKPPFVFTEGTLFEISDNTPELSDTFTLRCVINGITGPVLSYPEDNGKNIWENGGDTITYAVPLSDTNMITLYTVNSISVNSFDLYIDDVKVDITFNP